MKADYKQAEEIIARADELLPGVNDAKKHKARELVQVRELNI